MLVGMMVTKEMPIGFWKILTENDRLFYLVLPKVQGRGMVIPFIINLSAQSTLSSVPAIVMVSRSNHERLVRQYSLLY